MSTLGEHRGNGIRFDMHLSAPNGGVAQMLCRPEGQWVSWSEYDKLKAEVERLRKAGDAMAERCLKMQYTEVPWEYGPKWYAWHSKAEASVQAWNAAKEGQP